MADFNRYYELMEQARLAMRAAIAAANDESKPLAERAESARKLSNEYVRLRRAALAIVRRAPRD